MVLLVFQRFIIVIPPASPILAFKVPIYLKGLGAIYSSIGLVLVGRSSSGQVVFVSSRAFRRPSHESRERFFAKTGILKAFARTGILKAFASRNFFCKRALPTMALSILEDHKASLKRPGPTGTHHRFKDARTTSCRHCDARAPMTARVYTWT